MVHTDRKTTVENKIGRQWSTLTATETMVDAAREPMVHTGSY